MKWGQDYNTHYAQNGHGPIAQSGQKSCAQNGAGDARSDCARHKSGQGLTWMGMAQNVTATELGVGVDIHKSDHPTCHRKGERMF